MSDIRMETALLVPWGESIGHLTARKEPAYSGGSEQIDPIWTMQPIRFCVDRSGNFHLLNLDEDSILSYNRGGDFLRAVPLKEGSSIVDFLAEDDNYFLLRNGAAGDSQLECLDGKGEFRWVNLILAEQVEEADQILLGERIVGVTSGREKANWLRFDRKTGHDAGYFPREVSGNCSFLLEGDRVLTVVYVPGERRRGLCIFDPHTGEESWQDLGEAWYGPLATVFGANSQGDLFLYTRAGAQGRTELVSISVTGQINGRISFFSLLPSPDLQTVVMGAINVEGLTLTRFGALEDHVRLTMPDGVEIEEFIGRIDLSRVGNEGQVEFDLHDHYHGLEARMEYREEVVGPVYLEAKAGEVVSRMDGLDHWQVGGDDAVYIPVTLPNGLAIVRVKGM